MSSGSWSISLRNFAAYSKSVKGTDGGTRAGRGDCGKKVAWTAWDVADKTDRDWGDWMAGDFKSLVISVSDIIVLEMSLLAFWILKK